jgi:hypothetical protein
MPSIAPREMSTADQILSAKIAAVCRQCPGLGPGCRRCMPVSPNDRRDGYQRQHDALHLRTVQVAGVSPLMPLSGLHWTLAT